MFQNIFVGVGAAVALGGAAMLVLGGLFAPGGDKVPLMVGGVFTLLFGLNFVRVGRRIGRLVTSTGELRETGLSGTGLVTEMWETGVTINDQPVFGFKMNVEVEGRPDFEASVQQVVPRLVAGAVLPGATLAVKVDPEDQSNIAIDWSAPPVPARALAPLQPEAAEVSPAAAVTAFAEQGLGSVAGHVDIASLLRTGRRAKARLVEVRDVGAIGDLGLAEPGDAAFDDRLFVIAMDVKMAGRDPIRAQVAHRIPDRLVGRVGPGLEVVVFVDREEPQRKVAIDWDASGM